MSEISRLRQARILWNQKAVKRATLIREMRKQVKRLKSSAEARQAGLKLKIARLEAENTRLYRQVNEARTINQAQSLQIQVMCVLLVIVGCISFRAASRVLKLLKDLGLAPISWLPHLRNRK